MLHVSQQRVSQSGYTYLYCSFLAYIIGVSNSKCCGQTSTVEKCIDHSGPKVELNLVDFIERRDLMVLRNVLKLIKLCR